MRHLHHDGMVEGLSRPVIRLGGKTVTGSHCERVCRPIPAERGGREDRGGIIGKQKGRL